MRMAGFCNFEVGTRFPTSGTLIGGFQPFPTWGGLLKATDLCHLILRGRFQVEPFRRREQPQYSGEFRLFPSLPT